MASTITSLNATLLLGVVPIYPVPQQIQGFAVDDMFEFDALPRAEVQMGVDGHMSGGRVFEPVGMKISLMANSASNDFFDTWIAAQLQNDIYYATGNITLPATNKKYTMVKGVLSTDQPLPNAKKVLQARVYEIKWESISWAPVGFVSI